MHKMKHVTIDAPSLDHSGPTTLSHGTHGSEGLAISTNASYPGWDEDQTAAIEDYQVANVQSAVRNQGGQSNNSSQIQIPGTLNAVFAHHSASASAVSLGERLLERLQWKERIRHYTWTYFTMTMATGGVANVIYTGAYKDVTQDLAEADDADSTISVYWSLRYRRDFFPAQYCSLYH